MLKALVATTAVARPWKSGREKSLSQLGIDLARREGDGEAIDAVSLASRHLPDDAVIEYVSLMSSTLYAVDLGAHADEVVPLVARLELDTFELFVKAGPSGAAVELCLGGVGRRPARSTREDPLAVLLEERGCVWPLSVCIVQNLVRPTAQLSRLDLLIPKLLGKLGPCRRSICARRVGQANGSCSSAGRRKECPPRRLARGTGTTERGNAARGAATSSVDCWKTWGKCSCLACKANGQGKDAR